MKIMKILGLVVAVHAGVFMLIFAIPGCRTSTGGGAVVPLEPAAGPVPVSYTGSRSPELAASDLNPVITPAPLFDPNAPAVSAGPGRFSPTRPGAPAALPPPPEPEPLVTYDVVRGDSLWTVSKRHGLTVAQLAAANQLAPNATLQVGQKLVIPQKTAPASTPAAPVETAPAGATYTVVSGDTLGVIARRHGTTVATLRTLNRLPNDTLRPGQVLALPAGAAPPPPEPAAAARAADANAVVHVVAPGETLSEIARRYGVRYSEIATANNITDPARVRAGQELVIPGWQAPGTPAVAAPAPAATPASGANPPTVNLTIPGADQDAPPPAPAPVDIPVIRVDEPSSSPEGAAPRLN